jgi:hypothetical protein
MVDSALKLLALTACPHLTLTSVKKADDSIGLYLAIEKQSL